MIFFFKLQFELMQRLRLFLQQNASDMYQHLKNHHRQQYDE